MGLFNKIGDITEKIVNSDAIKSAIGSPCPRCGQSVVGFRRVKVKAGTLCTDCARSLRLGLIPKEMISEWDDNDINQYQEYVQNVMMPLKEKFARTVSLIGRDGWHSETDQDMAVEFDSTNYIFYFPQHDVYISGFQCVLSDILPVKSSYYARRLVNHEYYDYRNDSEFFFVAGFLNPFIKYVKIPLNGKHFPVWHEYSKGIFPIIPDHRDDQGTINTIDWFKYSGMNNTGMIRYKELHPDMPWQEYHLMLAHFQEEKAAMACYLHRIDVITEENFHDLMFAYFMNAECAGMFATKYKDYSPYFRPDEMKAFGYAYSGEMDYPSVHIPWGESGHVKSDEEIENLAMSFNAGRKGYDDEEWCEDEDIADYKRQCYFRSAIFYDTKKSDHLKYDLLFGLFVDDEDCKPWKGKQPTKPVFHFHEVTDYSLYHRNVHTDIRDKNHYTEGELWIEFTYDTMYHSGTHDCFIEKGPMDVDAKEHLFSNKVDLNVKSFAFDRFKSVFSTRTDYWNRVYEEVTPWFDYSSFKNCERALWALNAFYYFPDLDLDELDMKMITPKMQQYYDRDR